MAYDKRIAVFNGCLLALAAGRCSGQSIVNIGVVPGATQSWAGAVSADGSVVAVGVQGTESYSYHAYTWTAAGGFEDFGAPNASFLGGMSGDGLTVVGLDYSARRRSHALPLERESRFRAPAVRATGGLRDEREWLHCHWTGDIQPRSDLVLIGWVARPWMLTRNGRFKSTGRKRRRNDSRRV